jgi:hypothetical protein
MPTFCGVPAGLLRVLASDWPPSRRRWSGRAARLGGSPGRFRALIVRSQHGRSRDGDKAGGGTDERGAGSPGREEPLRCVRRDRGSQGALLTEQGTALFGLRNRSGSLFAGRASSVPELALTSPVGAATPPGSPAWGSLSGPAPRRAGGDLGRRPHRGLRHRAPSALPFDLGGMSRRGRPGRRVSRDLRQAGFAAIELVAFSADELVRVEELAGPSASGKPTRRR